MPPETAADPAAGNAASQITPPGKGADQPSMADLQKQLTQMAEENKKLTTSVGKLETNNQNLLSEKHDESDKAKAETAKAIEAALSEGRTAEALDLQKKQNEKLTADLTEFESLKALNNSRTVTAQGIVDLKLGKMTDEQKAAVTSMPNWETMDVFAKQSTVEWFLLNSSVPGAAKVPGGGQPAGSASQGEQDYAAAVKQGDVRAQFEVGFKNLGPPPKRILR